MKHFVGVLPATVEVLAAEGASVVTVNHTIRIKHRNDLKHKVVS